MSEHPDPRMRLTLKDMDKYLAIPRNRALVIWNFPVLYARQNRRES